MPNDDTEYDIITEPPRYNDQVAERADAFGNLAEKMEKISDDSVKELCKQMLRQLIRSIKTPPDADVTPIIGGRG